MTRWVGLGVEMARWEVKGASRGRESPPNESYDSLGVVGGADAWRWRGVVGAGDKVGWGKGPPNESLDSLGAFLAGDGAGGG